MLLLIFANAPIVFAQHDDEMITIAVSCAALLSVSATNMDDGPSRDFILSEADWYANKARDLVTNKFAGYSEAELRDASINNTDTLANMFMATALDTVQKAYNDGTYTWDTIVEIARDCSLQKNALD